MFWDMSNVSWLANLIYDNNFLKFIHPGVYVDQGNVPLYSVYLAILWKVFGRSLLVTHLAALPFIILLVNEFHKFSKQYIQKKHIWIAMLMLFVEPTLFTQVFLAGFDLVFCSFFLLAINSSIRNRKFPLLISIMVLSLIRIRGVTLVISVFLIDWYLNHEEGSKSFILFIKKRFFIYTTPIVFLFCWYIYHYLSTGWFFVSQYSEVYYNWNGLGQMLLNLLYIFWKACDFGRIFLFLSITLFLILRKPENHSEKRIIIILLFTILPYIVFFTPLQYPISHRHFMVTYIIGIVTFVQYLGILRRSKRIIIISLIVAGFVSGNFWTYPEKYGNGWDASMKVLPYFKIKNDFDEYVESINIEPDSIGAKFPMDINQNYTNLNNRNSGYSFINDLSLKRYCYIVQSNICNTFSQAEIDELNNKWICEKEFRSWPVYIRLFKNPNNTYTKRIPTIMPGKISFN